MPPINPRWAVVAFILCGALALALSAARAYTAPTLAEIAACKPDAFALCISAMPSPSGVFACLRANKRRLSADCRAVFDARGIK